MSDFEAEADVFADMELKTINDFAELQTILAANQSSGYSQQLGNQGPAQPANSKPSNSLATTSNQNFVPAKQSIASNGYLASCVSGVTSSLSGSQAPTVISSSNQYQPSLHYRGIRYSKTDCSRYLLQFLQVY